MTEKKSKNTIESSLRFCALTADYATKITSISYSSPYAP